MSAPRRAPAVGSWVAALVVTVLAASYCQAQDGTKSVAVVVVDPWEIPTENATDPRPYLPFEANCDDQIMFFWRVGNHGVFRLYNNATDANGTCPTAFNASVGEELAPVSPTGNVTYAITAADVPYVWLVNQFGNNCARGQKFQVLVNATSCSTAGGNVTTGSTLNTTGSVYGNASNTAMLPGAVGGLK